MNDAYDKGQQAYNDGQDLSSNPFEEGTDDFYDWGGGWVAASDEDEDDA